MRVKAKFHCGSVTDYGSNQSASLFAVYSTEGENADFASATPSGKLDITIESGLPASGFFKPRKDYYLYFEEVPEPIKK